MKRKMMISVLLAATSILAGGPCAGWSQDKTAGAGAHPELTEQEKLIACSECHQKETPQVYEQWFESRHGLGMVKCYECHGTFENLVAIPDKSVCMVCHSEAMTKCPSDKSCWDCHTPHTFKAKK